MFFIVFFIILGNNNKEINEDFELYKYSIPPINITETPNINITNVNIAETPAVISNTDAHTVTPNKTDIIHSTQGKTQINKTNTVSATTEIISRTILHNSTAVSKNPDPTIPATVKEGYVIIAGIEVPIECKSLNITDFSNIKMINLSIFSPQSEKIKNLRIITEFKDLIHVGVWHVCSDEDVEILKKLDNNPMNDPNYGNRQLSFREGYITEKQLKELKNTLTNWQVNVYNN